MHNGDVGDFRLVRRKLLASVCDEAFGNVYGSTDSEHFFALFIDSLLGLTEPDPALRMAQALARAISRVLALVQSESAGGDSYLGRGAGQPHHRPAPRPRAAVHRRPHGPLTGSRCRTTRRSRPSRPWRARPRR
jgi:glutamine amidotransferase